MNQPKPVLLLFLGAGFSADAGAPVMSEFLSRARERLSEDLLRRIDPGFYCAEYSTGERDNLETAYGAAVFREAVFGPGYRVATRVPRFTRSCNGPNIGEVVEAFERAIACLYGEAVLEEQDGWTTTRTSFATSCETTTWGSSRPTTIVLLRLRWDALIGQARIPLVEAVAGSRILFQYLSSTDR